MAEIVLAAAASHAPGLTGWFDKASQQSQQITKQAYERLAEEIRSARLDVLIMVANDHLLNFDVLDYPDFVIGLGREHSGPDEWFRPWLNVAEYRVPGHPQAAGELYRGLTKRGFRIFGLDTELFDDNFTVPMVMTGFLELGIPLVPIFQNCTVPPVPDQHKCYEVGRAMGEIVINELPAEMRVGLMGSGGLAHEPGGPKYFVIDEEFDRRFLRLLEEVEYQTILRDVTYERMEEAGAGGTSEILSWIVVMGAIGERPCQILGYTPEQQWRCGIGAVIWDMSQKPARTRG